MALTQVQGGLLESGAALNNIGAGTITPSYLSTQSQYTGFKNRLINGDMTIDQRNNGASVTVPTSGSAYPVDRFYVNRANGYANTATAQRVTDGPTGFVNSLRYTAGTAETPSSAMYSNIQQFIEGFNLADFGWGFAGAQPATLSFWVKVSITGTFGVVLRSANAGLSYPATFTVVSANTWQYVSINIPGPTTGGTTEFTVGNGVGVGVFWELGVGPSLSLSATGAWQAGNALGVTGTTKLNSTTGATYQITGAQLEKGAVATSFDYLPYTTELQLCQRYYEIGYYDGVGGFISGAGVSVYSWVNFAVRKRGNPTMSAPSNWTTQASAGGTTSRSFGTASVEGNGFNAQLGGGDPRAWGNWIANIEL